MHFILDKKDGTAFDVTSILEEDIIEICIWLGHKHPMGVLHYSVIESIVLFQLADDMQCATHGAIKVMVLCEEAIAIRASPPSATHVRGLYGHSGLVTIHNPTSTLRGEKELHLPAGNSHTGGEILHHLHTELGDLADNELCQLMEDLC